MKVLMVNKFLYPNGGSETYIFKIGEYLNSIGHEVQYFGMEHEGRIVGNHLNLYTDGMDFHAGKLQKLLYPFKILYSFEAKKKMLAVLEDMQPDVVHLNNINFQLTPSVIDAVVQYRKKYNKNVKILFTAHDYQWVCPNHMMHREVHTDKGISYVNCEECTKTGFSNCSKYRCIHNSRMRSILGTLEADLYKKRRTYELVDTIICPSEFMQKKISTNKALAPKTIMLRNFIEQEKDIDKKEVNYEKAAKIRNGSMEKDYVLYFGRFSKEKGMETLLQVAKECPEISFIFAGTGPMEKEVNKLSNIENLGFIKGQKLKALIAGARFSIYPSEWYENGPFSVMESLIAGTPVIGAKIGGIPELIKHQKDGLLFTSGDAQSLKEQITTLWNNREINALLVEGCSEVSFDTVEDYCNRLMKVYNQ